MEKTDPIRILIVGMHDRIGGVETFLMNYYRNIDRNEVVFDFISTYNALCFGDEIKELGGKIYNICSEKKNPIRYCKQLSSILKENNYNIIHINMLSAANILPVLVAKNQKIKHIIIHSHNSNTPSGLLRKVLNSLNKTFLCLGTDFFACSELAGEWLFGKELLKKHNLTIIHNAIECEKYSYNEETRQKVRKELKLEKKFVVGHIGRFSYQKNHEFLIDIFYEIQKQKAESILLLIGEGELETSIRKKVLDLGIEDEVVFLGITNKVEEYLQAMDVFVLPSRFEGLPVIGVEAQASGIECFFSDNITTEAKINDNVSFISLKESPKEWADKILKKNHKRVQGKLDKYDIKTNAKILQMKYEKMEK